ncbi:MAG: Lrp/AsnC family transcriptional regulator [Anaerolineae bacterium]|nr:Lrp/AsnC family transcriptional regulator [Anaerolineae bacterium]
MKKLLQESGFDDLDRAILEELQANCQISNADLARKIHLSQPAIHNRIKRLEKKGVIQRYAAILDRDVVGYEWMCFIHITMSSHSPEHMEAFEAAAREMPEVLECHRLSGEYDALMKVVIRHREELDQFIKNRLNAIAGVARIHTSLVLNEIKATTELPLK